MKRILVFHLLIIVFQSFIFGQGKDQPFICPKCNKLVTPPHKCSLPDPVSKTEEISFSMELPEASGLLFIDGEKKDSIFFRKSKTYSLTRGNHIVLVKSIDREDYMIKITVGKNHPPSYSIKMDRAFSDKNASQIKIIGDYYLNGSYGRRKSKEEAMVWYEKAAEKGDAEALYVLGKEKESVDYLRKSASQGNIDAQFELGEAYFYGHGVGKDYLEALKWYNLAAAKGHTESTYSIGYIYYKGYHDKEGKRNPAEAMKWFRKVSDDKRAQFLIGSMFRWGDGTHENIDSSMVWYLRAAGQDYAPAQKALGDIYYEGKKIRKKIVQGELSSARQILLKKYGDKLGINPSQVQDSIHYKEEILPPDYPTAFIWYSKAAEQDHAGAQKCLADMFHKEEGTDKNDNKAIEWYRKAVENYVKKGEITDAYNISKNNLIPLVKTEYMKSPAINKSLYAWDLGYFSCQAILQKQYSEAEQSAREAFAADNSKHWIMDYLAAALLFQGKYAEAEIIYRQYKQERKKDFLDDFERFSTVIPSQYKADVEKIKKILNE
ncbi:MAG: SEL1-like repeat protein [Prevotella sp.]|nr:SEL1-like repeat protein [Prevotella sp.]